MILHARGEGLAFPQSFWGGLYFFPGVPALEERADVRSRALRAETRCRCPLRHSWRGEAAWGAMPAPDRKSVV